MKDAEMPQTEAAITRIKSGLNESGLAALDRELAKAAIRIGASLCVGGRITDVQQRRRGSIAKVNR